MRKVERAHCVFPIFFITLCVCFAGGTVWGYKLEKQRQGRAFDPSGKKVVLTENLSEQSGKTDTAPWELSYTFKEGDNLSVALSKFGVGARTVEQWKNLTKGYYDLSKIKPGQSFRLSLSPSGEVLEFRFSFSKDKELRIYRENGGYQAKISEAQLSSSSRYFERRAPSKVQSEGDKFNRLEKSNAKEREEAITLENKLSDNVLYQGKVEKNFYSSAIKSGMDEELVMELSAIFAYDINFKKELHNGDEFQVLVGPDEDGEERIIAARIQTKKKDNWVFYYKDKKDKKGKYYNKEGKFIRGFSFIKPIKNARISSGYTKRRYHPILHYYRPHLAVDYAAPTGTPVRAAGDGVITFAGWKGGYGKYISIQHNHLYTTSYGHLSRFARGIAKGKKVKQGQVIGYVGMTGLATGPHLDYRVIKNGESINPIKFKPLYCETVRDKADFIAQRNKALAEIEFLSSYPVAISHLLPSIE